LEPEDAEGREILKRVAVSLYGAGTDTTISANASFFQLMSLHPEVQRKAQEEIDRVVGHDRLPCAQDKKDLPYCNAILREVTRLNPVVPLGEF
jgi:cytochrome P450